MSSQPRSIAAAILALTAGVALAAGAQDLEGSGSRGTAHAPAAMAEYGRWIDQLDRSVARLQAAERSVSDLQAQLRKAKQRRKPRGEAKETLTRNLEEARAELEEARRELPELMERARRDGVPPGVLREYEPYVES